MADERKGLGLCRKIGRVVTVCRLLRHGTHKADPVRLASPYFVWKGWLWYRHSTDMGGESKPIKKGDCQMV
ncbi:hypothetical protein NXW48_20845 [Phocaeicola vulgatus]|nr:hypothetical protein [Phocaeicola vulgatus]